MTQALSTRGVGTPVATMGQYARQPLAKVVPLSVFFLNMQGDGEGEEDTGFYGKRQRSRRARQGQQKKSDKPAGEKTVGGGDQAAHVAMGGQSTASSESATMSGGTPLTGGPSKFGATRATAGSMGSGNVARYPVPIGGLLRRTTPLGKAKRKKKSSEDRKSWMQRMMQA